MNKLFTLTMLLSALVVTSADARSPFQELEPKPCEFDHFVGQQVDAIMPEVKATDRPYRVVGEKGVMTMDHNPNRLTIIISDEQEVLKVSCS